MLYITKYQDGKSSFGGMVRVKDIESITKDAEFLTIDYINLLKFHNYKNGNGNFVYEVGLFRFDKIIPLLKKTKSVYFHTVGNFIKLSPYMYFFSKKKKIIDLHGSQPEELSYSNQNILSNIFSFFEKIAFRKCDYFIHVSHNMISHFKEKYSWHNKPDLYVPIFSSNLDLNKKINIYESSKTSRIQLGINEDEKVFLYSGGIQAWQKVDCVVNFSRKVINSGHTVILLSMQAEFFKDQLSDCLDNPNLIITSAKPEELEKYYLASNFGMMFRDDNVLNVVSSPTKMSEYLYYGIIPVLTSKKVGDFVNFGIDYIDYNSDIMALDICKSENNHKMICSKLKSSDKDKLKEIINEL